jgi:predicted metal-dependent hydrolase
MDAFPTIIRRPVKHARLRVCEDTSVEFIVPQDFTVTEIETVLRKKAEWIERKKMFFKMHPRRTPVHSNNEVLLFGEPYRIVMKPELDQQVVVDKDAKVIRSGRALIDKTRLSRWLLDFARNHLKQRVEHLSQKHVLPYNRCFVRSQKTRWGTCSTKKNISINWRLISAPEYVIDYVILHELLHTQVMDHSHRFWVGLSAICRDYKKAIEWLNNNRTHEFSAKNAVERN